MNQPTPYLYFNRLKLPPSRCLAQFQTCGTLIVRVLLIFSCFLLLLLPQRVYAGKQTTVIYPELTSPYKDVFETILDGISSANDTDIHRYPLPDDFSLEALQQTIADNGTDGIIALGKRGYLAGKQLQTDIPIVVGALSLVPNGISGVSLSADPDKLFARLKSLVPTTKRVFVVYSEKKTGWLIPLTELAAHRNGLQLIAYQAKDLREAMHHYRTLLNESNSGTDSIWLPLDNVTVNDDVVLPLLLQKAWDKNLAIISNKPSHAKRGALFAMYPENYGLGQELAGLLDNLTAGSKPPLVIPLKRLQLAVNMRTAAHLGLNFTPRQLEDFTLTFPSR